MVGGPRPENIPDTITSGPSSPPAAPPPDVPFVDEFLRVSVFITALLCLVIMSLTLGAIAAGRRHGYPRVRLGFLSCVNPVAVAICGMSALIWVGWLLPAFGLARFFDLDTGDFIAWLVVHLVWQGVLRNFNTLRQINLIARTLGVRASRTRLVQGGVVLLWVLAYAVLASVMCETGGPMVVWEGRAGHDEDPSALPVSIQFTSSGLPGLLQASQIFILAWAALGHFILVLAECIHECARRRAASERRREMRRGDLDGAEALLREAL